MHDKAFTTLVIGASPNPSRYSYLAVMRLQEHGYPVVALGIHEGQIGKIAIQTQWPNIPIHTVSMYLHPRHQFQYQEKLLQSHPARVIFNPGAENPALAATLQQAGIATIEACTLVLLSTHQFEHAGLNNRSK
ncbi:MAG: CoA-binding protein [Thermoflavifilum sp.]|nr:CoA-binding protein [Thermoflavifilum sp.]